MSEYNKWGLLVLLSSVFFSSALVLYFMIVQVPIDLDEEDIPPSVMAQVSESVDISQVKEFWVSSDLMIQKGAQVYGMYCALCHGPKGKGDGPAGRGLAPPPRDFTQGNWKFGGTRINLFNVVSKGSPGTSMASFSHIPKLERWALVHFVRSLSGTPAPDDLTAVKEFAKNAD